MQATRILLLLLLGSLTAIGQQDKKEPNFATNDEIQLVVTQSERAFAQYEGSISLEAGLPSMQEDKTGIDRDRELATSAKKLVASLKKAPNAFHGPGGLLLLGILDDASRNAALCNVSAFADIASGLMEKGMETSKAYQFMHIGQACQDVSVQLYTVSENVHALMLRELEGQQLMNAKASEAITHCVAMLKAGKKAGSEGKQ